NPPAHRLRQSVCASPPWNPCGGSGARYWTASLILFCSLASFCKNCGRLGRLRPTHGQADIREITNGESAPRQRGEFVAFDARQLGQDVRRGGVIAASDRLQED